MKGGVAGLALVALAVAARAAADGATGGADPDFAASKGRGAEEQLRERLRARVRTIPGTDTQFLIGGYLQLDGMATRKRQDGDEQNTFYVSSTPFGPAGRDYRLSARQSQLDWVSRTPTRAGPVWTRLQANLFPLDGTTDVDLNQLVVHWDERLTVGKTYSTFMDDGAVPTTLDYNGPSGVTFVRQWLARARVELGAGWALDASVEEPQADLGAGDDTLRVTTSADRPDLAARLRFASDAGHLQIAALSRRIAARATTPLGIAERRVDGSGLSVSGSVTLFDDDALMFQAATGKGVGRYFNDPLSATGVALGPGPQLELVRTSGATLYYQHRWAPGWTSVAGASALWVSTGDVRSADSLRRVVYASGSLLHRLTPELIVGAEILWGEAEQVGGASAANWRVQLSVRYLVF